jgi:biotin synthase
MSPSAFFNLQREFDGMQSSRKMVTHDDIVSWLQEDNAGRLEELWARADAVRRENVGAQVHLRGLIEFSNVCARQCLYCGLRAGRRSIVRYRLTEPEIMESVAGAISSGFGTVVLQSGEDAWLDVEWFAGIIRRIKRETQLAVTLSCGERTREELARWRDAGADRYLLRFETSDVALWNRIHPGRNGVQHRIEILGWLKDLGYETGSGIMVGIRGQSWEALADDIQWFRRLDLDMIGIGPYIPHPETPMGRLLPQPGQVPSIEQMTCKVVALARLVCPKANIPSTTALATIDREHGWEVGLRRGANVLMVNVTPMKYRSLYDIYPGKHCTIRPLEQVRDELGAFLHSLGRIAGTGPGASPNYTGSQRG